MLANKRVLITGGASGIGLALAKAMGRLGAKVLITGRRQSALDEARTLLAAAGIDAFALRADVSSADGRRESVLQAVEELGGLDILVNNAGVVRAGRLEQTEPEAIVAMVETNLLGPILLTREALPELRKSGAATIVNISSGIGKLGMPFYSVYGATKSGIAQFGNALRRELDGEGISVLNVFPVATDTPMMQSVRSNTALDTPDDVADAVIDGILSGAREVVRGDENRLRLNALEGSDPTAVDEHFRKLKPSMEEGAKDHRSL